MNFPFKQDSLTQKRGALGTKPSPRSLRVAVVDVLRHGVILEHGRVLPFEVRP